MKLILNRKLMLTIALSILVIGGIGTTFALTNPTPNGYDGVRVTHNSTTCFADEHIVSCKVDRTMTVTQTVISTVAAPNVAPFYDVYSNAQLLGVCWTWAEFANSTTWTAATPDADCHGVHN